MSRIPWLILLSRSGTRFKRFQFGTIPSSAVNAIVVQGRRPRSSALQHRSSSRTRISSALPRRSDIHYFRMSMSQ
ncbi:hypothetical protein MRB53_038664 [Persea americana]|nr:hypothetical protein MRB53_038664 [Persea americana]